MNKLISLAITLGLPESALAIGTYNANSREVKVNGDYMVNKEPLISYVEKYLIRKEVNTE